MLFVTVALTGFFVAAAVRRWSPLRTWQSVAATTVLAVFGAFTAGLTIMEETSGSWRPVVTVAGAVAAAVLLVHVGAAINHYWFDHLRRMRAKRSDNPDLLTRLEQRVDDRDVPENRINYLALAIRAARRAAEVRVTGLAAEMSYYGLISLVPLSLALGASLGFLERIMGRTQVAELEETLIAGITSIFSEDVADEILTPLIQGLLAQERTGIAIGSVAVVLWLASRMFRAAIRALDDAYRVKQRRSLIAQQALGLALAIGAVITLLVLLLLVVVGPLLGDGEELAEQFGLSGFFELSWAVLRWPAVAAVCAAYLTMLYRFGPKAHQVWTSCIPGAILGTILLIGIALGLAQVLAVTGTSVLATPSEQAAAVRAAAQMIGVVLAGVLWMWLSSIALLTGGVVNAELDQMNRELDANRGAETAKRGKGTAERNEDPASEPSADAAKPTE